MILKVKKLSVYYRNHLVGLLAETSTNKFGFQYDENWVTNGFSISPISLPLQPKIFYSPSNHFEGLFGVFYDSLPDGWGALLMQRKLAKMGIDYSKLSPLVKLSLVGQHGLGGLTYQPSQNEQLSSTKFNLDALAHDAMVIQHDEGECIDLNKLYELGGSSGGARPKIHAVIDEKEWIIKFPHTSDPKDIGVKEYQLNLLAKKVGILVPEVRLFPSKEEMGYFGSLRFDRSDDQRIHTLALSSLLETTHRIPNLDYAHAFEVISLISVNQDDQYELFRRMYFNVLVQNKDDHGKNMSFTYDDTKKGYVLAPAYDITSTPHKFEHEMTILGNGKPTKDDVIKIANKFGLKKTKIDEIINTIERLIDTNK